MTSDEIVPGVHLHIHETNKYRTQIITVTFLWPMNRSIRAQSFLLSYLLADTTEKYPRKLDILSKLDNLYGASLNVVNIPRGACDRLKFTITGIHVKGLNDDLVVHLCELMKECIFAPHIENGAFPDMMFEECREQAVLGLRIVRDDPQTLCCEAAARCYGGSPAGRILPAEKELYAVTSKQCAETWDWIVSHARIDIQILSDLSKEQSAALCKREFQFTERTMNPQMNAFVPGKKRQITKEKSIPQSHIVMLLESGIMYGDDDYPAYVMGNGIFGSLPVSLLFQNVREKQGLCYSIESGLLRYDGVLRVSTAVDDIHIDDAIQSVLAQLDVMKNGLFTDEDLSIAREMYVNLHRSSLDDPEAILSSEWRRALIPKMSDIQGMMRKFAVMDRESITRSFSKIRLKTISIVKQRR